MKETGEPAAVLYDGIHGLYATVGADPLPINEWSHLVQTFSATNGRKYLLIFVLLRKDFKFRFLTKLCHFC